MSVPAQAALADAGDDAGADAIFGDLKGKKGKDAQPSAATDVFRDLVPQEKRADYEAPEPATPDLAKHFVDHTRQFDTGIMSKLNVPAAPGEAVDTVKRAAGGAVGAYNFAASLPGMILAGLSAAPYAIGHAIAPDKVPSAGEAMDEESDLFKVHPSGAVGEGAANAEDTLGLPFTKAADLAGAFTAKATDPNGQVNDANFQSRFGIHTPGTAPANVADTAAAAVTGDDKLKDKVAGEVKDAQREAVTRTGGEFAANLLMMLGSGKDGAKAAEGKGEPAPAPEPAKQAPPQPAPAPPAQPAPGPDKAATGQNQAPQGKPPAANQVPTTPKAGNAPAAPSGIDPKAELAKAQDALKADPTSKDLQDRVAAWGEAVELEKTQAPAPAAPKVTKPFLTPQQVMDAKLEADTEKAGLTPAQAAVVAPQYRAPVDSVTGYNAQKVDDATGGNPRLSLIARAQQHVAETGQPGHYVEMDLRNMGGVNKAMGSSGANKVFRDTANIIKQEMDKAGGQAIMGRHGGDELNAVVVGAARPAVDAALARAKARVEEYAEKAGLSGIAHHKGAPVGGFGIHTGVAEISRGRALGDILNEADTAVERNKGAEHVQRGETAENRNQPGAATDRDTGGAGAPARPGEERPARQRGSAGGAEPADAGVRGAHGNGAVRPEPAARTEYVDSRLNRENYRAAFKSLAGEMEEGGGSTGALVGGDFSPLNDTLSRDKESEVRRLKSSNPKWVQRILSTPELAMSVRDVHTVIRKAAAGEALGVRQVKVAKALLDHLQEERLYGQGGLATGKAKLAQARELRLRAKIGDEGFDREPAHRYTEESYDPRMDGVGRTLYELETEARKVDEAKAEAIGERAAMGGLTNVEAAQQFQAILDEHGQAQEQRSEPAGAQGGQEPAGLARPSEGPGGREGRQAAGGPRAAEAETASLDLKASPGEARKTRYHGTSSPIKQLDDYHYESLNIYGNGLHTTDSLDTARGYTKKGRGTEPTIYKVTPKDVKLYNMEQPLTHEVRQVLDRMKITENLPNGFLDEPGMTLRKALDEFRDESANNFMSADTVQEYFQGVREGLEKFGYRGYQHIGGHKTGRAPHDVRIYWNPTQDTEISKHVEDRGQQQDMLGGKTDTQQQLHDATRQRDAARNRGQESVETGDGGDLFSEARKQSGMKFARGADQPTKQIHTPAFKSWFGDWEKDPDSASKVVDESGKPKVVYHGTQRPDRIGDRFRKSRATSGPMSFFTENPEIASGYAKGKADTSLANEDTNYPQWFKMKVGRTSVDIIRAWHHLDRDTQRTVAERLPDINMDDDGNITYQKGQGFPAGKAKDWNEHYLPREGQGNPLKAALHVWIESGHLFNEEDKFMKVLKLAGMPPLEYDDPGVERSAVYPVYLDIKRPLDATNMPDHVVKALEDTAARTRARPQGWQADIWDKRARDIKDWVKQLKEDMAEGKNSHVWTSIPDKISGAIKKLGYDGIHDHGGKNTGDTHNVWIPFEENQVKSAIGNRGTFDPESNNIMKSRGGGVPTKARPVGELRTELQRGMGRSRYDRLEQAGLVKLHEKAADLPGVGMGAEGPVRGVFDGTGMHLAADTIPEGKGMGVLLHEITHQSGISDDTGGLKSLLGKPFDALDRDFQALVDAGDKAAVAAHDHATANYEQAEVREERIARLVETVTNTEAAARPKTFSAKVLDLVQRVLGHLRRAVAGTHFADLAKKAGVNLDLQPKDYAALARASLDSAHERMAEADRGDSAPKKAMGVDKPTQDQVKARAQKVKDPEVTDKTESAADKLHNLLVAYTPDYLRDFWHGVLDIASPLSNGTEETAAIAKDYANAEATAVTMREDEDKALRKGFTPNERYQMWQATSNESVAKTRGLKLFESNDGFSALPEKLRAAAIKEQELNDPVADAAVARGIIPHRFKIYDPRFLTGLFKDGEGKDVLNALGHDIRLGTGHAKERLHVTADATEQAAKALYGDQAKLVRDIRIMPYARMRLRRIMAAQDLIGALESYGQRWGVDTVMPDDQMERPENVGKFFTVDNPAFRKDGKQIWVSKNFEGPLNAVLRGKDAGAVERAVVGLKSKAMSTIVGLFPPVHRSTVFFKTVLAAPLSMLTGRLQAEGRELRLSNSEEKYALINAGMRDVSMRGWQGSMDDIDKEATLTDDVGKSWTAKALGMVGKAAGTPVGKSGEWQRAVKETVDAVGDYWHSSIMWERVADTQYGLAQHVKRDLIKLGMKEDGANREAAQLANRFVGSIAREDMGKGIRTFLNMTLFSRSFTMSNVGMYKDAFGEGLPKAIRGKLDDVDKAIGKSYYRKKAAAVLVKDMATFLVLNSAIQSAVAWWTNQQTEDEIENGYKRRFADYLEKSKHNPLHALDLQSLTPNSENEPGKEDYIYLGRDAQGTGIYGKNLFGKVGQDLMDWVTSPAMTLKRKESTISRPIMAILDNDKGNGQMVYDPQGSMLEDVASVAKYVALQQGPGQTVQGAHDIVTGEDRTPVTVGKVLGAPFGVFLSKGAPGGPVAGMLYAMDKEHEYEVQQVMPDAYRYIRSGNIDKAIELMESAHMTPGEIRARIRFGIDPGNSITPAKLRAFMYHADDESQLKLLNMLNNPDREDAEAAPP